MAAVGRAVGTPISEVMRLAVIADARLQGRKLRGCSECNRPTIIRTDGSSYCQWCGIVL